MKRARRERSVTESLLSIVLLLEAIVLFFVALVLFGLKTLPPGIVFGGAGAFVVVILIDIAILRWSVGVALGWVIQAALIALGVLNPVMYLVGVGFAAFWVWCVIRARQIDRLKQAALVEPVETTTPSTREGDTP